MAPYYMSLNKAALLFFPSGTLDAASTGKSAPSRVVQAIIRTPEPTTVGLLAAFFLAQVDITNAIKSIAGTHMVTSLPLEIVLEGQGYILCGKREEWKFGRGLKLAWGNEAVRPCEDKWVFVFETT